MMRFDSFFLRKYDSAAYNCLHFTVDVQKEIFGRDLSFLLTGMRQRGDGMFNLGNMGRIRGFRKLRYPSDSCLCLFRGAATDDTHIGTFIDGRVFHISRSGVQFLPLEVTTLGFIEVFFYDYAPAPEA